MVVAAVSRREQGLGKAAHRSIQGSAGLLRRFHIHHTWEWPLHDILDREMDPGQVVKDVAPSLLEFVSPRDIKTTTVTAGLARRAWVRQISGWITTPAILDYFRLWDLVSQLQLGDNEDNLIWRWTVDGKCTSKSAYQALLTASHPVPGCSRIWKTWAPLRVKIFLWLAVRGRPWTDWRRRHGLHADDHCYLCDQDLETIDHIVASCSYSHQVWWTMLAVLGADASQVGGTSLLAWWDQWRRRWHGDKQKVFALAAWEIWKERNARCF